MAEQQPQKPSFLGSLMAGIGGYIKGALAGGIGGAVVGTAIGAIVGLFTGGVGAAALVGVTYGAALGASAGSIAGVVTDVVKSREAAQPSAEDVVNVAKISFAQGVAVAEHQHATTKHRDMIEQQRGQTALPNPAK